MVLLAARLTTERILQEMGISGTAPAHRTQAVVATGP
jgi:hypothetical protein